MSNLFIEINFYMVNLRCWNINTLCYYKYYKLNADESTTKCAFVVYSNEDIYIKHGLC